MIFNERVIMNNPDLRGLFFNMPSFLSAKKRREEHGFGSTEYDKKSGT